MIYRYYSLETIILEVSIKLSGIEVLVLIYGNSEKLNSCGYSDGESILV